MLTFARVRFLGLARPIPIGISFVVMLLLRIGGILPRSSLRPRSLPKRLAGSDRISFSRYAPVTLLMCPAISSLSPLSVLPLVLGTLLAGFSWNRSSIDTPMFLPRFS